MDAAGSSGKAACAAFTTPPGRKAGDSAMGEKARPHPTSVQFESSLEDDLAECAKQLGVRKAAIVSAATRAAVEACKRAGYRLTLPIEFTVASYPAQREAVKRETARMIPPDHLPVPLIRRVHNLKDPAYTIIPVKRSRGIDFAFEVADNCMDDAKPVPLLPGDIVLCRRVAMGAKLSEGDIAVVEIDEEITLRVVVDDVAGQPCVLTCQTTQKGTPPRSPMAGAILHGVFVGKL